jgi:hypothetical protein
LFAAEHLGLDVKDSESAYAVHGRVKDELLHKGFPNAQAKVSLYLLTKAMFFGLTLADMAEDGAYASVQKMLAAQACFPTSPMELFENARNTLTLLAADAPAEETAQQGPAKRGKKTVQ